MSIEEQEVQVLRSTTADVAVLVDGLLDAVVSEMVEEVTDEMDRMSAAERAELLAQVLREAGV